MSKNRITIMVPAYNEERNLKETIEEIKLGLKNNIQDYEILIFNDNSKDKTGKIANEIAKKNKKVKVIHNKKNRGMGYCYRQGLKMAQFEYYMYIPGDNEFPSKALKKMIRELGKADIIVPYVTNMCVRTKTRQIISEMFTKIMNILFGQNLPYYNGTVIHKMELLKKVPQKAEGHAYQAAILVRLLKSGASYKTVGYEMFGRENGSSSAFMTKNIKSVFLSIFNLFLDIEILRRPPLNQ